MRFEPNVQEQIEINPPHFRFSFVSTLASVPWGGSEFLWSTTAAQLAKRGHEIHVSVHGWPQRPDAVQDLQAKYGASIIERRPRADSRLERLVRKAWRMATRSEQRDANLDWLARTQPALVCISSGNAMEAAGWMRLAIRANLPFVTITQAQTEFLWPDDDFAAELREFYNAARRCFFVSKANQELFEDQIAQELPNAEVVSNPYNVSRTPDITWPPLTDGIWRLGCVARLHPHSKGQDLIIRVLARPEWRSRPVRVAFYGEGPQERNVRELAKKYEVEKAVEFCGHVSSVEDIWRNNHALILPSRYEGLPMALVEAMMCGRPAIVTNVAGNSEVLEDGVTGFVAEAPTYLHLNGALERAWAMRESWESMGKRAHKAIREVVPPDPSSVFTERLLDLVRSR